MHIYNDGKLFNVDIFLKEIEKDLYSICEPRIDNAYCGNPTSEVFYNFGDLFDLDKAMEKIKKKKQIIKEMTKTKERVVNIHFDGSKIDTLRQISHTDKMLRLLKFNERFGAGGRNNYLFACAKYLQDSGMSDDEVISEVLWINSQGDGISEEEISHTIFRSLRCK